MRPCRELLSRSYAPVEKIRGCIFMRGKERHRKTEEKVNPVLHHVALKKKKAKKKQKTVLCRNRLLNKVFLSPGPLYFSPKCRKHVYKLYHHTRDCTIPACKPHSTPTRKRQSLSVQCATGKPLTCKSLVLSPFLFSFLRLQEMCKASHATSRQPAVHGGVAHAR